MLLELNSGVPAAEFPEVESGRREPCEHEVRLTHSERLPTHARAKKRPDANRGKQDCLNRYRSKQFAMPAAALRKSPVRL